MEKHNLSGWIPDLPDKRDYSFKLSIPSDLPESVDLRPGCSRIEDQGSLGACTAHAVVSMLEYLQAKDEAYKELSRLFLYYQTRKLMNTVRYDSGASLRNTLKAAGKVGVCNENTWPYIVSKFKTLPPAACNTEAAKNKVAIYYKLNTLQEMKASLAAGYPFVCGISIYDSFESEDVEKTGIVNLPGDSESMRGGHAVMICGYDDNTSRFLVRNSWGITWGMKGYFTIPYEYLTNPDLASDFWVVQPDS